MLIEITYNVTDVFMSTTETPVYVEISFEQPGGSAAVWGSITGTLSNQTDLQNALNLKVPYTGATTNVNLGEYELKAGQLTLDTSPTGTAAVGTIRWNDTTGTSETTLKGGNVIIKNGVDLVARVVNKVTPNTTLTKAAYQAVRVSGAQGQRLAIELAQANNDAGSADTIGLVTETIAPNQEGFIMTVGQLEGINTTGSLQGETWVDGDVLYLSPTTAGAITNVKPTGATGHLVIIGYVEYAHANNGKIYVKVTNGFELAELHDTSIVTPTNNQGLFYNSSNSLWENKSIATALGFTPVPTTRNITINGVTYDLSADRTYTISTGISGSGASGQVTYWTGASAVSGSNNLFWDNANGRLGIGTNTPANALHISQNVNGSLYARISNPSSGNQALAGFYLTNNLNVGAAFYITSSTYTGGIANTAVFTTDGSINGGLFFQTGNATATIRFASGTGTEHMRLFSTGNLVLQNGGTFTDGGQRLQVIGDTLLRGSGNTNTTTALTVQNSDSIVILRALNNKVVAIGEATGLQFVFNPPTSQLSFLSNTSITGLNIVAANIALQYSSISLGINYFTVNNGFNEFFTKTTTHSSFVSGTTFNPTSGTATFTGFNCAPTINQTGGANGITRGLYVNPTLTAAADFRAIETTAGNVLIGWNQNAPTKITISNITSNTSSQSALTLSSSSGNISLSKYSATTNAYKIINANDGFVFNDTVGDLVIYNDVVSGSIRMAAGNSSNTHFTLNSQGNIGIGITPTVRLHVSGDTILKGSGATSATTALTVQNSDSTAMMQILNNGYLRLGSGANSAVRIYPTDTSGDVELSGLSLVFNSRIGSQTTAAGIGMVMINGFSGTSTSGAQVVFLVSKGFAPTSGTGTYVNTEISPVINQTGGANGITRGLYVNPTLTSAADFRAIETANGKIVFGNLPTSSAGLPTGALWNDAGTVKIV